MVVMGGYWCIEEHTVCFLTLNVKLKSVFAFEVLNNFSILTIINVVFHTLKISCLQLFVIFQHNSSQLNDNNQHNDTKMVIGFTYLYYILSFSNNKNIMKYVIVLEKMPRKKKHSIFIKVVVCKELPSLEVCNLPWKRLNHPPIGRSYSSPISWKTLIQMKKNMIFPSR